MGWMWYEGKETVEADDDSGELESQFCLGSLAFLLLAPLGYERDIIYCNLKLSKKECNKYIEYVKP